MRNVDHHRKSTAVELGDAPPLTVGEDDPNRYSRRGVSLRWLFGAVVTAVTSVALMGGALVAALDGRYVLQAQAAISSQHDAANGRSRKASKGDRVKPAYEEVSSRKILQVSTVVRQGERDLIAKRPYALVNASLVLDKQGLDEIPAFNARNLVMDAEDPVATTDAIYDKSVDGEITVSVSLFPLDAEMPFETDLVLDEDEIERQLRGEQLIPGDGADIRGEAESFLPAGASVPSNVTVVPENMSEIIKSNEADDADSGGSELIELVQPGDTLNKILLGSGIGSADIKAIDRVLASIGRQTLRPGQILRIAFQLEEHDEEAQRRPSRLSIYANDTHVVTVAMTDEGEFVLAKQAPPGPVPTIEDEVSPGGDRLPTIYESLYQTAINHNLPESVRGTLLRIFSLDVDFNARVRPGDTLTVLHSANVDEGDPSEILFASLLAGGVERRFYRFKADDGGVDFYDEDGRTGDKFLLRKPMARGVFRSGFGMRRHPILRRRRMHKGVDWAAPRGTRIYAAGDGVVKQAGWTAGYGRWVAIRHKNGYETGYAHQSRIAKGIKPGVRVKQGQVIGYVGSTGFSTGPHLHYEVRVNGRHVNPLKIRLRRGRELSGDTLDRFRSERDRINNLLGDNTQIASR